MRQTLRAIALVSVFVLGPVVLGAENCSCIWVDPEASIQAQIDAAPPGSTLCLPEGTWWENLVIRKPLTLRGRGPERTVIRPQRMDIPLLHPVLTVWGPRVGPPASVVVEGLTLLGRTTVTLDGWDREMTVSSGLQVGGLVHVLVSDCHILEAATGILLLDSAQAMISNVVISGEHSYVPQWQRGSGIALLGKAQAMVVESTIAQFGDGLTVQRYAQVRLDGATIENTLYGVHVRDDAQASITRTRIAQSEYGVAIFHRGHAAIADCTIVGNEVGVALLHYASAVVTGNVIAGSKYYGLLLSMDTPRWFAGFIAGANNVIPGPDELDGNLYGAVFPGDIAFLTTAEGGAYPGR